MNETELIQFLLMIRSSNLLLLTQLQDVEIRVRTQIENESALYGNIICIASSLLTCYAVHCITDYYKLGELLDRALIEIAPHISQQIENISPELNKIFFVKNNVVARSMFSKLDMFGFFSKPNMSIELSELSSIIIDAFKWISNSALSGIVGYNTRHMSLSLLHEFMERQFSSPMDFIKQFTDLRFTEKESVAHAFVLMQLRERMVEHRYDFDAIIQEGKLESFQKILKALTEFDHYITNHLRIIDENKHKLSTSEFQQFLEKNYGHFALNPIRLEAPTELCCPLSLKIMEDPVTLHERSLDGNTGEEKIVSHHFDRQAIEAWIRTSNDHLFMRNPARIEDLVPNWELKQKIIDFQRERAMMYEAQQTSSMSESSAMTSTDSLNNSSSCKPC